MKLVDSSARRTKWRGKGVATAERRGILRRMSRGTRCRHSGRVQQVTATRDTCGILEQWFRHDLTVNAVGDTSFGEKVFCLILNLMFVTLI